MSKQFIRFVLLMIISLAMSSTFAQDTLPAVPERTLAIAIIPALEPPVTADNVIRRYTDAIQRSTDAGATGNLVAKAWSELEPTTGDYTLDELMSSLNVGTQTYDQSQFLGIQVLNTTVKETPPDLLPVAFDAPEMIQRFQQLFDAILPHLEEKTHYVSIGNEVDVYLMAHPDEWKPYKQFYEAALTYIHQTAPWIKVGVTTTFGGTLSAYEQVVDLNTMSDVFIMTYYPLKDGFGVRPPDSPLSDFPQMVKWAGDKPLILQEVGYPAAESWGSSEADQADFVRNVFKAWDADAVHIPFLSYFAMGDFSDELCKGFMTYYGLPDQQVFYDFLCTLGLLKVDGTPRQAWQAFVDGGNAMHP